MSRRSRRINAKGRFAPGETFAIIPVEVLESQAYAALPDWTARVLVAIAAQYRGRNNGNLSLTREAAATLGVGSSWKVTAGLKLLTLTGLIRRTREGKARHGRGICALYAVAWKHIDPTPQAYPPIEHERPASAAWASWTKPDDWDHIVREAKRSAKGAIISPSPRGVRMVSPRGVRKDEAEAVFVPPVGYEKDAPDTGFRTPRGCSPLELPPGGPSSGLSPDSLSVIPTARKRGRPRSKPISAHDGADQP